MSSKKILLLGACGMAGHVVLTNLLENLSINSDNNSHSNLDVKATYRSDINNYKNFIELISNKYKNCSFAKLDLFNKDQISDLIKNFKPDYIINCAGILVKNSKDNPETAIYINSFIPHYLDKLSNQFNFKLIHISTDCVFSGKDNSNNGYTEQSFRSADDMYGRSKALGEVLTSPNTLTIRTSIIGPELNTNGTGLLHWFLNQSGNISGFSKAIWAGVTTLELSNFINTLIQNNILDNILSNTSGLFHLTNNTSIDKYSLLSLFKTVFNTEHITINSDGSYSVNKSFINTNNKLADKMSCTVPDYNTMIDNMKQFMLDHKDYYNNYKFAQ